MSARSLVDKAAEFYSARRGFESYRAHHTASPAQVIPGEAQHGRAGKLDTAYASSARRKPARMDRQRASVRPMLVQQQAEADCRDWNSAADIRAYSASGEPDGR